MSSPRRNPGSLGCRLSRGSSRRIGAVHLPLLDARLLVKRIWPRIGARHSQLIKFLHTFEIQSPVSRDRRRTSGFAIDNPIESRGRNAPNPGRVMSACSGDTPQAKGGIAPPPSSHHDATPQLGSRPHRLESTSPRPGAAQSGRVCGASPENSPFWPLPGQSFPKETPDITRSRRYQNAPCRILGRTGKTRALVWGLWPGKNSSRVFMLGRPLPVSPFPLPPPPFLPACGPPTKSYLLPPHRPCVQPPFCSSLP